MQVLKKDCRQPSKVLEQLNNRILERATLSENKKANGLRNVSPKRFKITASVIYSTYDWDAFHLSNSKPNNYCYLKSMVPIAVEGFFKDNDGEEYVIGFRLLNISNFFEEPCDSMSALGISQSRGKATEEEKFKINDILCKIVCLPFGENLVLIPMLHHCFF